MRHYLMLPKARRFWIPSKAPPIIEPVRFLGDNLPTSTSYSYRVTGSPVNRGDCGEEDEDCPEEKGEEDSEDSEEGETEEDPAEGGG